VYLPLSVFATYVYLLLSVLITLSLLFTVCLESQVGIPAKLPMKTWIALFRGINVGGNNILPMKELVRDLESLELNNVRTYIQSGNVVFQSRRKSATSLVKEIRKQINRSHGFEPNVILLGVDQLEKAMEANPFSDAESDPKSLHLGFLETKPQTANFNKLDELKADSESYRLIEQVFYFHAPDGVGRSKLAARFEACLGVAATARNWRTVQKLSELVSEFEGIN